MGSAYLPVCWSAEMKREFFRFLVTGSSATVGHYAVFWLCISVLGISTTVAAAIGYLFGSVLSYLMSYYYTFDSKRSHGEAVAFFYLMVATGFFINTGIVHALAAGLRWDPWISQVFATALTLFWNYIVSKLLVFGRRGR